jgi:integrase
MEEKRIKVWVQRFPDRANLMLQWIDPETGRRKSKSAKTADEKKAEAARGDLEADLSHGRFVEASRMSWERFRELFEEEYLPNCRPRTREVYANAFDLFEKVCGTPPLRSINARTVSAFTAGLRKLPGRGGVEGMQPLTVKVRLQFLRTALAWAARQGLIPSVPAFPCVKVPKRKPQAVPVESVERLLDKAGDPELRVFLLCGWLAGLRRKEAMALEREPTDEAPWVDFERERIWLPGTFVKAVEDQWVPLDPKLREALLSLPQTGRKVFHLMTRGDRSELKPTSVSDRIADVAKAAGVKLSMKSLRRGFGCRYAGKVPAQVLQKLMRHGDIKTTMTYYANVDDAAEEAILGPKRNRSRNTRGTEAHQTADAADVNLDAATAGDYDSSSARP